MEWWDEDILMEVLKRLDARSLAVSGCVNKQWRQVAEMESVWEGVCTKHWPSMNSFYHSQEMRAVVVALGGYRQLYLLCLRPVLSNSWWRKSRQASMAWSKEEVQLSLSLLSITCYERMAKLTDSNSLMFLCKPNKKPTPETHLHCSPICEDF